MFCISSKSCSVPSGKDLKGISVHRVVKGMETAFPRRFASEADPLDYWSERTLRTSLRSCWEGDVCRQEVGTSVGTSVCPVVLLSLGEKRSGGLARIPVSPGG